MILNISTLTMGWTPLAFTEAKEQFDHLKALEEQEEIQFTSPIAMALEARMVDTHVEVRGTLSFSVSHSCGRCLKSFKETMESKIALHFVEASQMEESSDEAEVELTEEAMDRETYTGETIDLAPLIQDEVVMALPQTPICNPGCKGLCKACGQDLNKKACQCDTQVGHPAFAKLKVLKGGKE